jgi:hypothetical protein
MTEAQVELAKRAAACKGWQWMPGMRTISGRRLAVVFGKSRTAAVLCDLRDDANSDTEELQGELPDLNDPATGGCLLELLGPSRWMVQTSIVGFKVSTDKGGDWTLLAVANTLGEACAYALLSLENSL